MLVDGIFQVITCGFPPLEDRDQSLKLLAEYDFFGGGTLKKEDTLRLADLEKRAANDMFVILSDIWLDNEERRLWESWRLSLMVLRVWRWFLHYLYLWETSVLTRAISPFIPFLVSAHPRLKEHSRFLFIPGPDDAGPSTVLPRCALPKYLTEELKKYIPNAIFSSNPCRIKFYTQEIVFFRQDLLYRMRRSCLIPPSREETDDPFEHLVATITHQSHLCPLPLTIVLADKSEQKAFKYTGITCFNPGSFSSDSTFVAYRPCTQEVEFSAL
ncbi:hypothetical protein WN943_015081 [Citrus x changshan-huyou]